MTHYKGLLSVIGIVSLATALGACGKSESHADGSEARCSRDSDCANGAICDLSGSPQPREMIAVPCYDLCTTDADCGEQICEVVDFGGCYVRRCEAACTETSCADDEYCADDRRCKPIPCDQPDAPECPEHWRCAPELAEDELPYVVGSEMGDTDPDRAIQRGCVRLRCNEDDGFMCRARWDCDPDNAVDGSGCLPLPCAEAGGCSNDDFYVCEPTTTSPRPPGVDDHGCVQRNCDDGRACTYLRNNVNISSCDSASPDADSYGCVRASCDQIPEACLVNQICDPTSPLADELGCRQATCLEGVACPAGWECDPSRSDASSVGCVANSGQSGTSGSQTASTSTGAGGSSSGAGGSSNSGSGTTSSSNDMTSSGGTSSGGPQGRCVAP